MVNKKNKTTFIAEIGINHNGSLDLAKKHIEKAKESGADIAKFQTYFTNTRAKLNSPIREILAQCELDRDDFYELKKFCEQLDIQFASTPFCEKSADLLNELGCETIKVASFHLSSSKLIKKLLNFSVCKKIIISTGVSSSTQIFHINNLYESIENNKPEIAFLHCVSEYPISSFSNCNLTNIPFIKSFTSKEVGYSDHSIGIEVPKVAVALGASIIEKHFTIDNSLEGADHAMSANPEVFKNMVEQCNNVIEMFGNKRSNEPFICESNSVQFCVSDN